jgi:hypothetical protein
MRVVYHIHPASSRARSTRSKSQRRAWPSANRPTGTAERPTALSRCHELKVRCVSRESEVWGAKCRVCRVQDVGETPHPTPSKPHTLHPASGVSKDLRCQKVSRTKGRSVINHRLARAVHGDGHVYFRHRAVRCDRPRLQFRAQRARVHSAPSQGLLSTPALLHLLPIPSPASPSATLHFKSAGPGLALPSWHT